MPETPPNENRDKEATTTLDKESVIASKAVVESPRESKSNATTSTEASATSSSPLVVHISVDLLAVGLLLAGIASRMIFLDQPRNVV